MLSAWVAVWAFLTRFQKQGHFWHDIWAGTRLIRFKPISNADRVSEKVTTHE
jgi:hypothetical protein